MKILLVTFDNLTGIPAEQYEPIYAALKAQGTWWHYMKATWLIQTAKSVQELSDILTPLMNGKGLMLITELHRPYQGLLAKDAWEWINSRIN